MGRKRPGIKSKMLTGKKKKKDFICAFEFQGNRFRKTIFFHVEETVVIVYWLPTIFVC